MIHRDRRVLNVWTDDVQIGIGMLVNSGKWGEGGGAKGRGNSSAAVCTEVYLYWAGSDCDVVVSS